MESRIENGGRGQTTEKVAENLKTMWQSASQRATEQAQAADKIVREHPYQTIGLAFGVGVLIGVLLRRR
jgi:ElaB/YqjD/DUF883 family membrane-anchored ribosome-binding protein